MESYMLNYLKNYMVVVRKNYPPIVAMSSVELIFIFIKRLHVKCSHAIR